MMSVVHGSSVGDRMKSAGRAVVLRRRLVARRRAGCALAVQALENFDAFYDHAMSFYRIAVSEEQDSQTPILDAILRFLQFLDESGILDLLLKLLFGLDIVSVDDAGAIVENVVSYEDEAKQIEKATTKFAEALGVL